MKNTAPTSLSHRTKRWFVRDTGLPICVVQEPYFTAAVEAINPHYDSIAKLKLLIDMMLSLDTMDTDASGNNDSPSWLAELTKKLCGDVVCAIQTTGAYQAWASQEPQPYQYQNNGICRAPIYAPGNVGKTLLSIDLVQANFNSLRLLSKDIVLGFDTYAELIGHFTKHEYFKQSKHFRQVIFGSLLPSRQQTLCRIMMDKIVTAVLLAGASHVDIKLENIVSLGNDEVVLEIGSHTDISSIVDCVSNVLREDETTRDIAVRVEAFVLRGVSGTDKKFYVKEHVYPRVDHVEFKCIPSHFFLQVYKHYTGQTVVDTDLVFHHEGELATFMKPLFTTRVV